MEDRHRDEACTLGVRLRGGRRGFEGVVAHVSCGVALAIRSRGNSRTAGLRGITEVVRSVLADSAREGEDAALSAKAILVGVLRATGEKGRVALAALSETSRVLLFYSVGNGLEASALARGCVLGAVACAPYLGVEREEAVSAAGRGALEGAAPSGGDGAVRAALHGFPGSARPRGWRPSV